MGTIAGDKNDDESSIRWVQDHLTALLTPRPNDKNGKVWKDHIHDQLETLHEEEDYLWHPSKDYFPDDDDPRRLSFVDDLSTFDFCLDQEHNFISPETQHAYRRWQLANQIHHCCFTCWKYNIGRQKHSYRRRCRFGFTINRDQVSPKEVRMQEETIFKKRKRKRIRYHAPRNNGNINASIKSPLVALGHGGNHDCQRIANLTGAAEYIATYNSKQEEPDFRLIENLYASKIASLSKWKEELGLQHHLRAAANAIYSAQHIGTVQAAYTLLKLPFVQSSRRVITINCERRSNMTKSIIFKKSELDSLDSETSAELKGLQSSLGRRHAYFTLVHQQRNLPGNDDRTCHVSLFALFTSYSLRERKRSEKIPEPKLLLLDDNGFIKDAKRFSILETVFTVNRKKLIVNMSPFVPVNLDDERFCWAMLLLHVPWPEEGESGIIKTGNTAVQTLATHLESENSCPILLKNLIGKQERSQAFLGGIDRDDEDKSSDDDVDTHDDDSTVNFESAYPTINEVLSSESFDSEDVNEDDNLVHVANEMEKRDIKVESKQVKKISKNYLVSLKTLLNKSEMNIGKSILWRIKSSEQEKHLASTRTMRNQNHFQ